MFEFGYRPDGSYTEIYANNCLYAVIPDNQFCCQQSILPMVLQSPDCYNLAQQVASAMKAQDLSIASGISSLNAQLERDMRQGVAPSALMVLNNNYLPTYTCCAINQSAGDTIQQLQYQLQTNTATRILTLNEQRSLVSCCCEKENVKIEEPEPEYYESVEEINSDLFKRSSFDKVLDLIKNRYKTQSNEPSDKSNVSNLTALKIIDIIFALFSRLMFKHGEITDIIMGVIFAFVTCVLALGIIKKEKNNNEP